MCEESGSLDKCVPSMDQAERTVESDVQTRSLSPLGVRPVSLPQGGSPYSPELSPFTSKESGGSHSPMGLTPDSRAAQSTPFMTFGPHSFFLGSMAACPHTHTHTPQG